MPTISGSNLSAKRTHGSCFSMWKAKQTVLSRTEVGTKWPWVLFPRTAIPAVSVRHSAALRPVLLEINQLSDLHKEKKAQCQRRLTIVLSILFTFQGSYKLVRHTHTRSVSMDQSVCGFEGWLCNTALGPSKNHDCFKVILWFTATGILNGSL